MFSRDRRRHSICDAFGLFDHRSFTRRPRIGNRIKQLLETWSPPCRLRWVIRPNKKRHAIRGFQERRKWPTTTCSTFCCLRINLTRLHINVINVRPLLAVDFDANKRFIHLSGTLCIFKAFVFHHVTPMARCVTNGKKNRDIAFPSDFESLRAPRPPIDRVPSVLKKVWTVLFPEPVSTSLVLRATAHRTFPIVWQ